MRHRSRAAAVAGTRFLAATDRWRSAAAPLMASLFFSSGALAAPCFSVSGTQVSVHRLFAGDSSATIVDLEDMPSVSTMVSRGSEAHNLTFMDIERDARKKAVKSFAARIDNATYQFPANSCSRK